MTPQLKEKIEEIMTWAVRFEKTLSPTYAHMLAAKVPELCDIIDNYDRIVRRVSVNKNAKPATHAVKLISETISEVGY